MPRIKQASRFRRRVLLEMAPFVVVIFATFFWWSDYFPDTIRKPAEFTIVFVSALAMAVVVLRRVRRFTCPDCGTAIPGYMPTHGKPGVPVRYHCNRCDVIWETGLNTVDD